MIRINKISVNSCFSLDFLDIEYRVDDTPEDLSKYVFDIYRSNSPDSEFNLIAANNSEFSYKDYGINLYNSSIKYYYKVNVKNIITGEQLMSDIFGELMGYAPDAIASSIIQQYQIYLDNIIDNKDIFILLKRRFGQKCPVCWDDVRMQPRLNNCHSCYGTGYAGGYFKPIKSKMSFMSGAYGAIQEIVDMADNGETEGQIQIWVMNYPLLHTSDIIVDSKNRRYQVQSVMATTKNDYVLRQIVGLSRIPEAEVIYDFPLEV